MSKDYTVLIPHFYSLEYNEGNYKMTIEVDFRDAVPTLYFNLINNWDSPNENEIISPKKKEEILKNINDYLIKERGFNVEIIY